MWKYRRLDTATKVRLAFPCFAKVHKNCRVLLLFDRLNQIRQFFFNEKAEIHKNDTKSSAVQSDLEFITARKLLQSPVQYRVTLEFITARKLLQIPVQYRVTWEFITARKLLQSPVQCRVTWSLLQQWNCYKDSLSMKFPRQCLLFLLVNEVDWRRGELRKMKVRTRTVLWVHTSKQRLTRNCAGQKGRI